MGISYLLDIVIGLFFIYLILSLLASEIQELITTIFQWRAIHVKESIEGLLSGNETQSKELADKTRLLANQKELADKTRLLANQIYNNPLIKDLNHEAKGLLAKLRSIMRSIIFGKSKSGIFGEGRHSGPSSISKQVFASSFLETLQIPFFTKEFIKLRLNSFIDKKISEKNYLLKKEDFLKQLNDKKVEILKLYDSGELNLALKNVFDLLAIEPIKIDADLFNTIFKYILLKNEDLPEKEHFLKWFNDKKLEILNLYDSDKLNLALKNVFDLLAIESIKIDADLFNTIFEYILLKEEILNLLKKDILKRFNDKKVEILRLYDSEKLDFANVLDSLATESKKIDTDLFNTIFEDTYQNTSNTNNITGLSIDRRKILIREITPTVLETISLILLYKRISETCKNIVDEAARDAADTALCADVKPRNISGLFKASLDCKALKEIVNGKAVKEDEKILADKAVKDRKTNKIMYELINQNCRSTNFIRNNFGYIKYQESYMIEYINECLKLYAALKSNPKITDGISELVKKIPEIPEPLQKSLEDLAKRSQVKIEEVETQLSKFQVEIEDWFDRSMTRASGVYKRNAKLVAFMIGLIIAITTNADTLHIVDRLAKDQVLRESVNRSVDQIVTKSVDSKGELTPEVKGKIKTISDQISLPIGWSKDNINPREPIEIFGFLYINPWILRVFGWMISGIAISMGASFWYDLLGKFIDIKNVGKKTPNSSDSSNSSNQN